MTASRTRTQRRRHGLRVRLWLAVLAGPLAATLVAGSVVAAVVMAGTAVDPMTVVQAISAACLVGIAVAILTAAWLTHGIAVRLRDLEDGIERGHLPESRRERGWGEIGDLSGRVRALLETDRDLREDEAELRTLHTTIDNARDRVERWIREERWEPLTPGSGALAPLADSLDRGITRLSQVQHQNLEASHQAHGELLDVIEEASGSAELAEHGYVEVTALLTTIREISRLTAEIQQATQAPAPAEPAARPGESEWRDQVARAIEELVQVSGESVQHLGEGLLRVREINEQVQLMSNRATLIALNAVVAGRSEARGPSAEQSNAELKQLAREVRAATERVTALSGEIDRAVEGANERMREVRDHVVARLVELPAPPAAVAGAPPAPLLVGHWIERLREMVQDATRKGERLSESQERVSSAVQRVSRKLQDGVLDLEGLVARLTPMGSTTTSERTPPRETTKSRLLRLLESEGGVRRQDPSAGEEGGA